MPPMPSSPSDPPEEPDHGTSGAVPAALPQNELARLDTLRRYGILDTPPEQAFDDIAMIASALCDVPIAMVTLVDAERQWFKANRGLGDLRETPRELAFCSHAILEPDRVFEVNDALNDPRFATNPLVQGAPGIRFYAGAPLVAPDGMPLGTVCVVDRRPRQLCERERQGLASLARQAVAQLELRHIVADLTVQSTTDVLTGAWNRRAFDHRLRQEWNRHARAEASVGLLMVDVDRFKAFNDQHGHPAGDQALIEVVRCAQAPLRAIDFLARFGGEELVVILPNTPLVGAAEAAERVRQAVERATWSVQPLTVSIGVAADEPRLDSDPRALIARADRALYEAKARGRNRVCVFERWI